MPGCLRNIALYRRLGLEGADGKLTIHARAALAPLYADLYFFSALNFLCFVFTLEWFFLGGALACIVSGRRRRDWIVVKT